MATTPDHTQDGTLLDDISRFYADYYREEIAELAQKYPGDTTSLFIDWQDIYKFDMTIADDICTHPQELRGYFEEALEQFELPADVDLAGATVRIYNLPATRSFPVGAYRSNHIAELIAVEGQVAKQTEVKPQPVVGAFECQRCGTVARIEQDGMTWQEPHECPGCERQGPFTLRKQESDWQDIQAIRLQLPPEQTKGGNSATLDVLLRDDIVDVVEAGDRVTVTGQLDVEDPSDADVGCTTRLQARSVQVEESDYQDINVDQPFVLV